MREIILGSQSPRRRELLKNAGIEFSVITSDCEEKVGLSLDFPDIVKSLAEQKSEAVCADSRCPDEAIVITADTMVVCGGKIMGKPKDDEDAFDMLSLLSGNTHFVLTGYCIVDKMKGEKISGVEETAVRFRRLSEDEIVNYIKTGEPRDKAGAYGIQLRGSMFVEHIEGDYFNIVGLPVCRICKILKDNFGLSLM